MVDILAFLQQRQSHKKLVAPAPNEQQLAEIFKAASRAPDHGLIRPWRFLVIQEQGLERLGEVFAEGLARRSPGIEAMRLDEIKSKALRAPMIIVVISTIEENVKVPELEQKITAGCAALNVLLAADALGYGGIWRTGAMAEDAYVKEQLGLASNEHLIGYLYMGTPVAEKQTVTHDLENKIQYWG